MAYNPDVYNTTTDVKTLQQRIEDNFAALLSTMAGDTTPSTSYIGTLWYNSANNTVQVRSSAGWKTIFYADTGTAAIGDGSVTAAKIANTARKGSIVQDQNIAPATCSIRANPVLASLPGMTEQEDALIVNGPTVNATIMKQIVYIPQSVHTLYMRVRATRLPAANSATIQFKAGSATSNNINVSSPYSWSGELSADVSGIAGWEFLIMQTTIIGGTSGPGVSVLGYGFRSNE